MVSLKKPSMKFGHGPVGDEADRLQEDFEDTYDPVVVESDAGGRDGYPE
jgi:hypothetical protein